MASYNTATAGVHLMLMNAGVPTRLQTADSLTMTLASLGLTGDFTLTGNLVVSGTTTTVSSTSLTIADNLIGLNNGPSGTGKDGGFVIERFGSDVAGGTSQANGTAGASTASTITLTGGSATVDAYVGYVVKASKAAQRRYGRITVYPATTTVATVTGGRDENGAVADFSTVDATWTWNVYKQTFVGLIWDESVSEFRLFDSVNGADASAITSDNYKDLRLGSLAVTAALTVGTTLGVTGASTFTSGAFSTSLTVGTTLGVSGALTGTSGSFSTTLAVTGASTFTGATAHNGGLTATSGTFSTTLGVTGALTGTSGAFSTTLAVTGASTFTGATAHNGGLTATSGSFSTTLAVTGASTFTGATAHNGGLTATSGAFSTSVTVATTLGVTGAASLSSYLDMTGIADPGLPAASVGRISIRSNELWYRSSTGEVQITSAGGLNLGELSGLTGTTSDSFTVNSDLSDANADLVLGRTTGGSATLRWNGTTGSFDKAMSFTGTLAVTGASTFTGATAHNGGLTSTSGTFSTTLGVTGLLTASGGLTVTGGNTNVSGGTITLTATGAASLTSTAALTLTGAATSVWSTSTGDLTVQSAGVLSLTATTSMALRVADNTSAAWKVWDGTDTYLTVGTNTSKEYISLGSSSTNPAVQLCPPVSVGSSYSYITSFSATSGEAMAIGDVVYMSAADTVRKATNAAAATGIAMGIAAGTLAGADWVAGTVVPTATLTYVAAIPGQIVSVNTDMSGFALNAPVYLSTAGGLTTTAPTAALSVVFRVGFVQKVGAIGTGKLLYMPQYIAQN